MQKNKELKDFLAQRCRLRQMLCNADLGKVQISQIVIVSKFYSFIALLC